MTSRERILRSVTVASLDPAPNSHVAPVTTSIIAGYDTNIDGASVDDRSFAVHAMFTGQIVAPPLSNTINVVGDTITFTPDAAFRPGELVQATSTNSILNISDGTAQTPDEMYFGTGSSVPVELGAAKTDARQSRMQVNRTTSCPTCELHVLIAS